MRPGRLGKIAPTAHNIPRLGGPGATAVALASLRSRLSPRRTAPDAKHLLRPGAKHQLQQQRRRVQSARGLTSVKETLLVAVRASRGGGLFHPPPPLHCRRRLSDRSSMDKIVATSAHRLGRSSPPSPALGRMRCTHQPARGDLQTTQLDQLKSTFLRQHGQLGRPLSLLDAQHPGSVERASLIP